MKVKVKKHFFAATYEDASQRSGPGVDLFKMIDVPSAALVLLSKGLELNFKGAWEKSSPLHQESIDRISFEIKNGRSLTVIHLEDEEFTKSQMIKLEHCEKDASDDEIRKNILESFSITVESAKKDGWKPEKP